MNTPATEVGEVTFAQGTVDKEGEMAEITWAYPRHRDFVRGSRLEAVDVVFHRSRKDCNIVWAFVLVCLHLTYSLLRPGPFWIPRKTMLSLQKEFFPA